MVKVVILAGLMAITGLLGYLTFKQDGFPTRANMKELNRIYAQFVGPMWQYTQNEICQKKYPLPGSEKYGWWFCMSSSQEQPTLLLLGNSYANHLYPGVIHEEKLKHHHVLSIGTCDPGWAAQPALNAEVNYGPCSGNRQFEQMKFINRIVAQEKSIRYVIMNGLSPYPDSDYIEQLKKRIYYLEAHGAQVILFVPHIRMNYDIKGCYGRPFKPAQHDCELPLEVHQAMLKRFNVLAEAIKKTNPSVLFFDQNTLFCNDEKCTFKLPTMPAFRDEYAHFSEFASDLVMNKFTLWAQTNVPDILDPKPNLRPTKGPVIRLGRI